MFLSVHVFFYSNDVYIQKLLIVEIIETAHTHKTSTNPETCKIIAFEDYYSLSSTSR